MPFRIDEEKWADSYFKTVLSPMEEMGVDFWWLDWQQWLDSKYTVAQCPNFILEDPFNINRHLEEFDKAFENLTEILEKHKYSGDRFKKRLLSQLKQ